LDRSGSMAGLEKDTIGGYNSLIEKQKKEEGKAHVTTVLFDDQYKMIYNHCSIDQVETLTSKVYYPRGMTALLDAIGKTILNVRNNHQQLGEKEKPSTVLFVITTDGHENASTEFSYHDIKTLINKQKEIHDWEFLFLGANIDASKEASKFGINKDKTVNYNPDEKGVNLFYTELSKTVSSFRKNAKIDEKWNAEIQKDYITRK